MTERIRIHIFPDGRIQAKTYGIKGTKCVEYIHVLETLLEAETVDSTYTSEYYENEATLRTETQQQIHEEGR